MKIGDRYRVTQDLNYINKDDIVTIETIENMDKTSGISVVTFKEYPKSSFAEDEQFMAEWGFPHPNFVRIEQPFPVPDSIVKDLDEKYPPEKFDQYAEHEKITAEMSRIYRSKNADYGDSFAKSVQKRGLVSAVTRIEDKFQRFDNIVTTGKSEVKSESLEDTLLDMANYAIMTVIEIRRKKIQS